MISKRLMLGGFGVLLLIVLALLFAFRGETRYRADARVLVEPYTNVFFLRSFQSQVIHTIPEVLALHVTPALSAIPGSGVPVLTNGVGILVTAVSGTSHDAQLAANEASAKLCQLVSTNYGMTAHVVDRAATARRYSFFHDTFQPGVAKLFKD